MNVIFWYGDHSDRVTSDLVSISVIKSIYVLFCTIDGKSMGISESCRPFNLIISTSCFVTVLCGIYYVVFLVLVFVVSLRFSFFFIHFPIFLVTYINMFRYILILL